MMKKIVLSVLAAGVVLMGGFAQAEAAPANSDGSKPAAVKVTTTAGRTRLGDFAPEFARYNDDVLFGEVWSRNDILSLRERSLITVASLMSSGILDSSLKFHINNAKNHGVTKEEMAEVLTQLGFYAGWPKAWAAFNMAKEVYAEPAKK